MVAEMHNPICSDRESTASEAAPMYTPKSSFPMSPPSGQGPPSTSVQSENVQGEIVYNVHAKKSNSESLPPIERHAADSVRVLCASNQIRDGDQQSVPYRTQEPSKYSRNTYSFHSRQSYFSRDRFPLNGDTYYEQYCSNMKIPYQSASNIYQNTHREENQDKSDEDISFNAQNKIHSELNQSYDVKEPERRYCIGYSSAYGPSYSLYSDADSSLRNSELYEKGYSHTLTFPTNTGDQYSLTPVNTNFPAKSDISDSKLCVQKGNSYATNEDDSFVTFKRSTNYLNKCSSHADIFSFKAQQTVDYENHRKATSDQFNGRAVSFDTKKDGERKVRNNEKEEQYVASKDEAKNIYFKRESYSFNQNSEPQDQPGHSKYDVNERFQTHSQNNDALCLNGVLKNSYVQPNIQVKDSSVCDLRSFSSKDAAVHQKQYEKDISDALMRTPKNAKKRKYSPESFVKGEKAYISSEKISSSSNLKLVTKNYIRRVIFKPYCYDAKDKSGSRNDFCSALKTQVYGESDGGSDGEKGCSSTASAYSVSPSPSTVTSEGDAPVDLRRAAADSDDQHVPHVFISDQNEPQRRCLVWACKACKKNSVQVNRREAATVRERNRLQKVNEAYEALKHASSRNPDEKLTKVDILKNAIEYIESLENILHVSSNIRERDCDSGGSDYGAVNSPPYLSEHYQHFSERTSFSSIAEISDASTTNVSSLDCLSLIVQSINPNTSTLLSAVTMDADVPNLET